MSTKNYLLQSVSQVLTECQRLVSVLSNVTEGKCQDCHCCQEDLWWDDSDMKKDVSSSCFSDVSDLSEKKLLERIV